MESTPTPDELPDRAEVVVVGAGHNSLVAAAYLARSGLEVLVLEAGPTVGGNTRTEELTLPGFAHDSCSSAHVLIQMHLSLHGSGAPSRSERRFGIGGE